jgi:hypothetical protein
LQGFYFGFEPDERGEVPRHRLSDGDGLDERPEAGVDRQIAVQPDDAEHTARSKKLSGAPAQVRYLGGIRYRDGGWHRRR